MELKKDKQKVLGEHFDDERIKTFLNVAAYGNVSGDFCALERAYRGMIAENFATFVRFFVAAGMDINATNGDGKTVLQIVKTHRLGEDYAQALIAGGAQ
jgi:ankyrin repeat protein